MIKFALNIVGNLNPLCPLMERHFLASDRDGGYGGIDIIITKNNLGSWGEPVNLGPTLIVQIMKISFFTSGW